MMSPSIAMYPLLTFSSWLMQRSSVLLPEPEAPSTTATSPAATVEVDPVEHLVRAVALADVVHDDHRMVEHRADRRGRRRAPHR